MTDNNTSKKTKEEKIKRVSGNVTDKHIQHLKEGESIAIGSGLIAVKSKTGKTVFRLKRWLKGKQILLTLGAYPALTLAEARDKRNEIAVLIDKGLDPRQVAKEKEQAEKARQASTLEAVSYGWLETVKDKMEPVTHQAHRIRLEKHVFPVLGNKPVSEIEPDDIINLIEDIQKTTVTVGRKVKGTLSRVFDYAINHKLIKGGWNPAENIRGRDVIKPYIPTHHKYIEGEQQFKGFLQEVNAGNATIQTKSAVKMLLMIGDRKMELCKAEWSHINLDEAQWYVPAENTKKRREQVYPLPKQAIAILKNLKPITGRRKYVFSSGFGGRDIPMSHATVNQFINRTSFRDLLSPHGFRTCFTTWAGKNGVDDKYIRNQLSHKEQGQTRQAYFRDDFLSERAEIMQRWADYIDKVTDNGLRPNYPEEQPKRKPTGNKPEDEDELNKIVKEALKDLKEGKPVLGAWS